MRSNMLRSEKNESHKRRDLRDFLRKSDQKT